MEDIIHHTLKDAAIYRRKGAKIMFPHLTGVHRTLWGSIKRFPTRHTPQPHRQTRSQCATTGEPEETLDSLAEKVNMMLMNQEEHRRETWKAF
ncbi:uncharacterized protein G2W53_035238 [Senna tora]|uniref:Uncharacterized protein n=1 Tax=Senna tora TaxID=362788 RepID=A0A834SPX7_9FABA|nr:uncharacterized protein G2W53_035238 [Senna tora]